MTISEQRDALQVQVRKLQDQSWQTGAVGFGPFRGRVGYHKGKVPAVLSKKFWTVHKKLLQLEFQLNP